MLVAILLAVLLIPCCGGLGLLAWKAWKTGADSPNEAISELFQALKYDDIDRLSNSLCASDRSESADIIQNFRSGLEMGGFELQTITWQRSGDNNTGKQSIDYTLAVSKDTKRYKIQRNAKLQLVEERGWRVCDVTGLKI
ncbi:hypothetical protein [Cryptosporangium sp. NPDC051539]|uniref:hypothetical protein n=1 Tax=Cryptosporangium sp. NPDC051539 TaxID=3363962 RepID=UPI0037BA2788